jgi:hypothetical protein
LDPRVHRHDHTIQVLLRQQLPVIGVHAWNAEIACTPTSSLFVDVAARHQIADRTALGEVANRGAEDLRRVMHCEPEARVEILHGMAPTAHHRDAREAIHAV